MKALVTGGTGFIGANVVRELLNKGYDVKVLVRKNGDLRNLEGLKLELVTGDIRDTLSLGSALEGCDYLFHVAATYAFWTPNPEEVYRTNVTGTENILNEALKKKIKKVVFTSSESTIKISDGTPGNESLLDSPECLQGHYKRSKCMAEMAALKIYRDGLPLVIVNPTTPIGALDIKPTPTGKIVVNYLNKKMPGWVNTGLNVVDVEDVAKGHVLALEKGIVGERYVLGNRNMTLREIFGMLEKVTGIPAPRFQIPYWVALSAGYVSEFVTGKILGKEPIAIDSVKAAHRIRYFDCSKAVKELGMPQTPVEQSFEKAVRWFRENGYIKIN